MRRIGVALAASVVALAGCGTLDEAPGDASSDSMETEAAVALGPEDGRDLPPVDLERVRQGQVAPDFTLASLDGPPVTLSDFRGEKNVVLVFYRGHW
jgi:cytochrome oxidase Cu insertion factor (SCO1/SenC/PrrC family)